MTGKQPVLSDSGDKAARRHASKFYQQLLQYSKSIAAIRGAEHINDDHVNYAASWLFLALSEAGVNKTNSRKKILVAFLHGLTGGILLEFASRLSSNSPKAIAFWGILSVISTALSVVGVMGE